MIDVDKMADIKGYEGKYKVDKFGNVYSFHSKRFLKAAPTSWGYLTVYLHKKGKGKTHKVHRLVAETFIENPDNKKCVNHIDGNKLNNCVDNLEWCTYGENMIHAWANGLSTGNKYGVNQWTKK